MRILSLCILAMCFSLNGHAGITQERNMDMMNGLTEQNIISGVFYNLGQTGTCFLPTAGRPDLVPHPFQVPSSSEDSQNNNELISSLSSQFPLCNLQQQEEIQQLAENEVFIEQPMTDFIPLDYKMYQTDDSSTTFMDNLKSRGFVNRMRNLLLPNMFRTTSVVAESDFFSMNRKERLLSTVYQGSDEDSGNVSEGDAQTDDADSSLPSPFTVMGGKSIRRLCNGSHWRNCLQLVRCLPCLSYKNKQDSDRYSRYCCICWRCNCWN